MKRMGHWSWVVGACVLKLGMGSIAIASSAIPQIQSGQTLQLSQGLQGQCRQAYENIFIYRTRSPSEPISSVVRDELVILAEDSARDGWIAVSSPTTGF
ncbi:MAG: hypothetical protein SVX43_21285, partial [Cyanobacteriota bacterium]|nr:hypothetical protein [Cyanobacteriota bacterium]